MVSILLLLAASCVSDNTMSDTSSSSSYAADSGGAEGSDEDGFGDADTGDAGDSGSADTATDTAAADVCDDAEAETKTLYMSADDSNSQASPVVARALINGGSTYGGHARPWEFLNYADFDYAPAERGDVRIDAQMAPSTGFPGDVELVVAVVAPDMTSEERPSINLTFSVDCSGSMNGTGISMAKAAMKAMAHELNVGDVVSVVTWNTSASVVLEGREVTGADDAALLAAIDGLTTGGRTDLAHGLEVAYDTAETYRSAGRTNRVVLLSDGGANTGVTDEDRIGDHAAAATDDAIYLIGVGTAQASTYDSKLMDRVTDLGRGAHVFVDTTSEATHQFTGERFLANLELAAGDVRLSMDLPAGWVIERFSGEQISTNPDDVVPQNLAPNDQMIYHLTLQNCSGDDAAPFHFGATWTDRGGVEHETTADTDAATMLASGGSEGTKAVALIDAATAMNDVWNEQASQRAAYMAAAAERAATVAAQLPDDADLADMAELLAAYSDLF